MFGFFVLAASLVIADAGRGSKRAAVNGIGNRPYAGNFSYVISPPGAGVPILNQHFGYSGSGTVSDPELGAFTEVGTYQLLSFVNGIGHVTGQGVQTFAHGTLSYTFDEIVDYTHAPALVTTVTPGTWLITGGTGRYHGATGYGTIVTPHAFINTTTGDLLTVDIYTGTWNRPDEHEEHVVDDIAARVHTEIEDLHLNFFQAWYRGELPNTDAAFSRLSSVLSDDFFYIAADSSEWARQATLDLLRGLWGTDAGETERIAEITVRGIEGSTVWATYKEYQNWTVPALVLPPGQSSWISSAVFTLNGTRLLWRHLHETYLPA